MACWRSRAGSSNALACGSTSSHRRPRDPAWRLARHDHTGYERDDFPRIYRELVEPADIILITGPIWLGDQSSQTRTVIERLYAYSGEVNAAGQWSYYGKVGGAVTTGNEDGGKHVSAQILYALQHIGVTVPPQSDAYWVGEAGPGPSYLDAQAGGAGNAWTTRNTVFMTWNLLHFARMLKDAGGVPAYGNSTFDWDLSIPDHPNPEYRAICEVPASTNGASS